MKNEDLMTIVNDRLYAQEKELVTLLAGNPQLLSVSKLIKYPVIQEKTDEGYTFIQHVVIVPKNYEGELLLTFEEADKIYPTAILATTVKVASDVTL